MGGVPTKQAPDRICSLRYGNHEISLVPLTRRYFNDENAELKRQFVRVRNDPSIRYNHLRTTEYGMTRLPPPSYTMEHLERLLNQVEAGLYDTNEEFLIAGDDETFVKTMEAVARHHQNHVFNSGFCNERGNAETVTEAKEKAKDGIDEHKAGDEVDVKLGASIPHKENDNSDNDGGEDKSNTPLISQLNTTATDNDKKQQREEQTVTLNGAACRFHDVDGESLLLAEADIRESLTDAERLALRQCKRQLRPVPCAVVFVYLNGRDGMDCFDFRGRKINVIGYFGCRTYDDTRDDEVPYLQARKAILKAAGDRTLERVMTLAAKLYMEQFMQASAECFPHRSPLDVFQERFSRIPMVVSTQWNSYPTLKFLYDTAALAWAIPELRVNDDPPVLTGYQRCNGEKGVMMRFSGNLLSRCWMWVVQLLSISSLRGDWAQYMLGETAAQKDKIVTAWLASSPNAKVFLGGEEFTTTMVKHLEELHHEIVRARETTQEDTNLWTAEKERSHDRKVYHIFNSPVCGPFLTTVKQPKDQTATQDRKGPGSNYNSRGETSQHGSHGSRGKWPAEVAVADRVLYNATGAAELSAGATVSMGRQDKFRGNANNFGGIDSRYAVVQNPATQLGGTPAGYYLSYPSSTPPAGAAPTLIPFQQQQLPPPQQFPLPQQQQQYVPTITGIPPNFAIQQHQPSQQQQQQQPMFVMMSPAQQQQAATPVTNNMYLQSTVGTMAPTAAPAFIPAMYPGMPIAQPQQQQPQAVPAAFMPAVHQGMPSSAAAGSPPAYSAAPQLQTMMPQPQPQQLQHGTAPTIVASSQQQQQPSYVVLPDGRIALFSNTL